MTGSTAVEFRGIRRSFGATHALDGLDVVSEQFFAADLEGEQIERRLAEAVADRITTQLAGFYAQQPHAA